MATNLDDATRDAARDLWISRILSILGHSADDNPLRWLDSQQVFVDAVAKTGTGSVEKGNVSEPISEEVMALIKAHLERILNQARSLQSRAVHDSYNEQLTICDLGSKSD